MMKCKCISIETVQMSSYVEFEPVMTHKEAFRRANKMNSKANKHCGKGTSNTSVQSRKMVQKAKKVTHNRNNRAFFASCADPYRDTYNTDCPTRKWNGRAVRTHKYKSTPVSVSLKDA